MYLCICSSLNCNAATEFNSTQIEKLVSTNGIVDTTQAVIHHTESGDVSADEIDRWHKERGWDGIGYHFVIRKNGTIELGRSLNKLGAHAKGRNNFVGIVLTGRRGFTQKQKQALEKLLLQLKVQHIERHHENCPGSGIYVEQIDERLRRRYENKY